jgi:hypothetical protein
MTGLTIGYEFIINLAVKKRNGKTFKSHLITGLGCTYSIAMHDVFLKLKKKRTEILMVNSVRVCRIAFAIEDGKSISIKLADHPPVIPENLNEALKYLPKF